MNTLHWVLLKIVRWTGWPLLPLVIAFLITGYGMSGRFEFDRWLNEQTALTLHRLLHWPLMVLLLAHTLPAVYLALHRWGWIRAKNKRD
jgi:hypothetical protein